MSAVVLARKSAAEVLGAPRSAVDAATLARAQIILDEVKAGGEAAMRSYAERFADIEPGAPHLLGKRDLERAHAALPSEQQALLERTATRIRTFAGAQRAALRDTQVSLPGGEAGHQLVPVERAGCYAPGGRFPLPSSVLMTAVTARVAGVSEVWVASPKPSPVTLAAAHVAGADGLLAMGGVQAIAALAYGIGGVPAVDTIVGPGNRWVTAAKQLVSGVVGIDMLAGPSELVVLADDSADADTIAADLIGQAEHDVDALPVLVTTHEAHVAEVERALERQLSVLSTAPTARASLQNGYAVIAASLDEALSVVDRIAPEHLELMVRDARAIAGRVRHAGAVFVGAGAAEVLGDYGAGPNHVLPTGGTARHVGGLSVMTFLRMRTWLRIDDTAAAFTLVDDAEKLAMLEGLEGHAASAAKRKK